MLPQNRTSVLVPASRDSRVGIVGTHLGTGAAPHMGGRRCRARIAISRSSKRYTVPAGRRSTVSIRLEAARAAASARAASQTECKKRLYEWVCLRASGITEWPNRARGRNRSHISWCDDAPDA